MRPAGLVWESSTGDSSDLGHIIGNDGQKSELTSDECYRFCGISCFMFEFWLDLEMLQQFHTSFFAQTHARRGVGLGEEFVAIAWSLCCETIS
eukprot:5640410-Amphidinium_carterae.1